MAFNQSVAHANVSRQQLQSVASSLSLVTARDENNEARFDELSSSGVDSDWILFSPSLNEDEGDGSEVLRDNTTDVLSTTGGDHSREDNEEQDDDDSLIDSLNTAFDSHLKLSLPTHSSGAFLHGEAISSSQEENYYTSLQNNDYITNRIDNWRREQARLLIDDLHKTSDISSSSASHHELLASWGVDDRHLIETQLHSSTAETRTTETTIPSDTRTDKYSYHNAKRFYGDDLFENFTEWEVSKIKQVAKQLSSSLVRDSKSRSTHDRHQVQRTGRRSSLLHNLTQSNKFSINLESPQPFWKKDLSSAHSSLSFSTSSIMFGNITLGDVM